MTMRLLLLAACAFAFAGPALAQTADPVVEAGRAAGTVGEQSDGYLGVRVSGDADLAKRVAHINIQRRAVYTDTAAAKTGVTVVDVGAATACQLFQTRVPTGQYYRTPEGQWRKRETSAPIALPSYCGR
ncbi:MAG: YdbL family protein [Acetobacteraceae bacterium]|nr:YdbL family protein [Acetobacteraceae bacterium]